jgi:FKBP-type peptidyl-prolyl cis-trans isomerase
VAIVPPSLGFGAQGHGTLVPPHSYLYFDVELIEVGFLSRHLTSMHNA